MRANQRRAMFARMRERQVQIQGPTVQVVTSPNSRKIEGVHAIEKGYSGSRFFEPKSNYTRGKAPHTYIVFRQKRYYG